MSRFFVKLKPAETYTHTHTHTHTHTCNLLLSPKQIGTICFAIFSILISAPLFAACTTGLNGTCDHKCRNSEVGTYSGTSNIQATWEPNTIALHWYNGDTEITSGVQTSCVYDGALTPPTTIPTKTGYTFKGWRVRQCLSDIDTDISGINFGFKNDSTGESGADEQNASNYGLTLDNTWVVEFSYGLIYGEAKCSAKNGDNANRTWSNPNSNWIATYGDLENTNGDKRNCWCKVIKYVSTDSRQCNISSDVWVYFDIDADLDSCKNNCAWFCTDLDGSISFRQALFGVAGN